MAECRNCMCRPDVMVGGWWVVWSTLRARREGCAPLFVHWKEEWKKERGKEVQPCRAPES